jgi:hypothetical protein
MKNFNLYTILSIIFILIGLGLWIDWIIRYGIVYDIGIYSVVIVFLVAGIIGTILSLSREKEEEEEY